MSGLLSNLRDFGQGASNAAASAVSGPVDLLAMLLRKAGVPVPNNAVGGSEWMAQQGLTAQPMNRTAGLLGEAAGLISPIAVQAKAPQIARGLLQMGENVARPSVGMGQRGAVLASTNDDAARMQRMQGMGLERGWFRGGPSPIDGRRTGPWYTRDSDEAANYAKRFGEKGDVREYAIPKEDTLFRTYMRYPSRMAHDLADILNTPEWGAKGAQLAKELRSYAADDRVPGYEVWQALESRFGNDGAAEALSRLMGGKAFAGATGMTGDGAVMVFKHAPVRDASKAAFDPGRAAVDDIYGAASPELLAAMTAGLGLGLGAPSMFEALSSEKQSPRKNP